MIPKDEQPYKIPDNWCWKRLSDLSKIISKGTTPKGGKSGYVTNGVRFLRVENLNDDGTISHNDIAYITKEMHNNYLKRSMLHNGDILISIAGTLGKTGFVRNIDLPMNTNQAICFIRLSNENISGKYIKYYLDSPIVKNMVLEQTKVTAIPNLTLEIISNILVPLSSFDEQQRIVDIIESLFAKLDRAKELAQNIIDNYELRRSAILHKAFTGQLTNSDINSWQQKKLYEIGLLERGRSKHRPRNDPILFGGKFPFIQTGDVANAKDYIVSHKQTLSDVGLQQSRMFSSGTLCITIAANIGDVAILTYDCCFPDSIVGFTPKENINVKYVYYKLKTIQKILQASAPATAQKNINLKVLSEIKIILPSFEEQKEIVCILDSLLAKEQRTKELAEQILQKIDLMKKSILARAFRGELGRND